MLLRNYLDQIFKEMTKAQKQRNREYNGEYNEEKSAPTNAPSWSIKGYKGPLYNDVKRACNRRSVNHPIEPAN
jgi:hypothetical protein